MMPRSKPDLAYYLTVFGGGLSLSSSIVIFTAGLSPSVERFVFAYSAYFNEPAALIFIVPSSLVTLYLSKSYLERPQTRRTVSLIVTVMSVISLTGVVWSGLFLVLGLFFSGPPISFVGGLVGLLTPAEEHAGSSGEIPVAARRP